MRVFHGPYDAAGQAWENVKSESEMVRENGNMRKREYADRQQKFS